MKAPKRWVRSTLVRLARSRRAGPAAGFAFEHLSGALPVHRLRETPTLIAFHHPAPSYPVHILIVPKRARRTITDLTAADADFMIELFAVVRELVSELGLESGGWRLVANGGAFQDVPQAHFHLIASG